MQQIGLFEIESSFKLTNRGIVVFGQIFTGIVKIGAYLTFEASNKITSLKIGSIEMMDSISTGKSWVALTFIYENAEQKEELKLTKLKAQLAEITESKFLLLQ